MNNIREIIEELYRVDAKYWETGDIDILPKRTKLAQKINEEFYIELNGIMRIVTQKHYPVQTFIDILQMLGFDVGEVEEVENNETDPKSNNETFWDYLSEADLMEPMRHFED